jgi:hypothetical protein
VITNLSSAACLSDPFFSTSLALAIKGAFPSGVKIGDKLFGGKEKSISKAVFCLKGLGRTQEENMILNKYRDGSEVFSMARFLFAMFYTG